MTLRKIVFAFAFLLTISTFAFAQDTTCGVVWGPVIKFSPPQSVWEGGHWHPLIANQGDTIHCIWYTEFSRLPYRRSTDGGITWEETRDLISDTITFQYPPNWQYMTANSNQVSIFLVGGQNGSESPVYLLRSSDRGTTWGEPIAATEEIITSLQSADVRGDTAAASYTSIPRVTRTTNDGATWSRAAQTMNSSYQVSLALSPGLLNVATNGRWWPGPGPEIVVQRSADLADTWKDTLVISSLDSVGSDYPYLASHDDGSGCNATIGANWRDAKYGGLAFSAGILGRLSYDNGKTWGEEQILTNPHHGFLSMIAIRKNIVATTWTQEDISSDTFRIQVRISTDGGLNWNDNCEATPESDWATFASIAISDGAIHVAWEEAPTDYYGNFEIYYRRGTLVLPDVSFATSNGSVEFDSLEAGLLEIDSVGITNSGTDTLSVSYAYSDREDFSVTPTSLKIAPNSQGIFHVNFHPKNEGDLIGKVIFISNAGGSPDCITVEGTSFWHKDSVFYPISNDWQLVSKPLSLGPGEVLPSLFSYNSTYILENSIVFGRGYWAKPPSNVIYQGAYVTERWMEIRKGWNLIGSISEPVAVNNITSSPPGIVTSQFYGYGELYFLTDTINPGKAYWVKSSQNGELLLSSSSTTLMSNKIKIVPTEDLPPSPPNDPASRGKPAVPSAYGLEQNYPNPFNSLTVIRYQIPANSWVSLRVYNLLGGEIVTLVNGIEEPGYKSVKFDAGKLSSGIYFYRLQVGNYVDTKKLLLLR